MSQVFPKSANAWSKASILGRSLFICSASAGLILTLQRSDFVTPLTRSSSSRCSSATSIMPAASASSAAIATRRWRCRRRRASRRPRRASTATRRSGTPARTSSRCAPASVTTSRCSWVRVHDLPDFVYFNHSIHVRKGVGCETCHGRVDRMPLMMQKSSLQMEWCLDCHRDPVALRPSARPDHDDGLSCRRKAQAELGPELVRAIQDRRPGTPDQLLGVPPMSGHR